MKRLQEIIGKTLATIGIFAWLTAITMIMDVTSKKMSPEEIRIVKQIDVKVDSSVDYKKMTWDKVLEYIETPDQDQDYLDRHMKFMNEPLESFKENHEDGTGVCNSYAINAAAPLKDNGYSSAYLCLAGAEESVRHCIFVYRTEKGYGCRGNTPLPARYKTIGDLVKGINKEYGDWKYTKWLLLDLDKVFPKGKWITGKRLSFGYIPSVEGLYTEINNN